MPLSISIEAATLRFGERIVFENLDAEMPAGEIIALTGPSGSGKSSLLAAIAGYVGLSSGAVSLHDGVGGVFSPSPDLVAWVPQGSNALGARTVLDNVMIGALARGLPLREAQDIASDQLRQVGLTHRARASARDLSGGELQRVAIARALVAQPAVILADEPSANLDARNTEQLAELFDGLASDATLVVATHDPILANAASTTINLRPEHG